MSRLERLAFAAGDVHGGGSGALLNVLYLFFLTDVIGLGPAVAGGVFAVAKVVDAVARPGMGQLTDNTRTRWGRRRPYLLLGAPLVLVAALALWAPVTGLPDGARVAWAAVTVVAHVLVGTLITVPYASLSTEATTDLAERNRLNLMRLGFSTAASALVFVGATALMQAYKGGTLPVATLYVVLAGGFGGLFALVVLAAGVLVRERTPVPAGREPFRLATFTRGFRLPAFRSLLGMYLAAMLTMDGIGYLLLAYTSYVVRVQTALFMGLIIAVNLGFVLVSQRLVGTVSKNRLYGTGLPLAIAAGAGVALWPDAWPTWPVYLLVLLMALGMAGAQMMSWVMFPDVVDAGELAFGERSAGSFSGLLAFVRHLCSAVLVLGVGLVLQLAGYRGRVGDQTVTAQPQGAVWGIRLTLLALVVVLPALGWWLARRYPLTRAACAQQAAALRVRRGDGDRG